MSFYQPDGYSRGNRYEWDKVNGGFVYSDTGEPMKLGYWNQRRPCTVCGEAPTPQGHDACLGTLPGVKWACCGHGGTEEPYVVLEDGTEFRKQAALDKLEELKKGRIVASAVANELAFEIISLMHNDTFKYIGMNKKLQQSEVFKEMVDEFSEFIQKTMDEEGFTTKEEYKRYMIPNVMSLTDHLNSMLMKNDRVRRILEVVDSQS